MFFLFPFKSTFTFLSTCLDVDSFCFQILYLVMNINKASFFFSSFFFPPSFSNLNCQNSTVNKCNGYLCLTQYSVYKNNIHPSPTRLFYCFTKWSRSGCNHDLDLTLIRRRNKCQQIDSLAFLSGTIVGATFAKTTGNISVVLRSPLYPQDKMWVCLIISLRYK